LRRQRAPRRYTMPAASAIGAGVENEPGAAVCNVTVIPYMLMYGSPATVERHAKIYALRVA